MDTQRLAEIYGQRETDGRDEARHSDVVEGQQHVANVVIDATATLIKYMQSATTKTEVVNQLETIGTPDALKVIPAIEALHETLKQHENVDLSDLTAVMRSVFDEVKAIPKELPEPQSVTIPSYDEKFDQLTKAITDLGELIKAQELTVEAPVVNVPEANVQVDAPDLSPISEGLAGVQQAVNNRPKVQKTQDISGLITEQYDQFVAAYEKDEFSDEGEPRVSSVKYLLAGKTVAKLTFEYTNEGDIKSVKKS